MSHLENTSYRESLKATTVIAATRVGTILVSIIRTKMIALLLGPASLGFINFIASSGDLIRVLTNFGLDSATVRNVAAASSAGDREELAVGYRVAFISAIVLGSFSWIILALISPWLAHKAGGNAGDAWLFILGGGGAAFTPLLAVQLGYLQGIRRLSALATCQLVSSPLSAATSVALVYFYGKTGGVFALTASSLATVLVHLYIIGKNPPPRPALPINYKRRIRENLRTGSGFAINATWLAASGWLNLFLLRHHYGDSGLHQVGMFGAASMLTNIYVGIVISALATDLFPALTACRDDLIEMRKLLNRQAVLSMDLGVVASLFGLTTAPWILAILYSEEFANASEVLRLLYLATAIRFFSFPLGFTILALNKPKLFAYTEITMGLVYLSCSFLGVHFGGLAGLGWAQIAANTFQAIFLLFITLKLSVSWNRPTAWAALLSVACISLVFGITLVLPDETSWMAALPLAVLYSALVINRIRKNAGLKWQTTFTQILPNRSRNP